MMELDVQEKAVHEWVENVRHTPSAYYALGHFIPQAEGEIEVLTNEMVRVLEQHDEHGDADWWKVQRADEVVGYVSTYYLEEVTGETEFKTFVQGIDTQLDQSSADQIVPSAPISIGQKSDDQNETEQISKEAVEQQILRDMNLSLYGAKPYPRVFVSSPCVTGTVYRLATWLVTVENMPSNQQEGEKGVRRKYEDFLWLRDYLQQERPDIIIPPLDDVTRIKHIFRLTIALQTFLDRLFQHEELRKNPTVDLFLLGSTEDLKAAKKTKAHRPDPAKATNQSVVERNQSLLSVQEYCDNLARLLSDWKKRAKSRINATTGLAVPFQADLDGYRDIANEKLGSEYLKSTMSRLANQPRSLLAASQEKVELLQQAFYQQVKDIVGLCKEMANYIDRIFQAEDTAAYWAQQVKSANESMLQEEAVLESVESATPAAVSHVEEPSATDTTSVLTRLVRTASREVKGLGRAMRGKEEINRHVAAKQTHVEEVQEKEGEARDWLQHVRAVMWSELAQCDLLKDREIRRMLQLCARAACELHTAAAAHYNDVIAAVQSDPNPFSRTVPEMSASMRTENL